MQRATKNCVGGGDSLANFLDRKNSLSSTITNSRPLSLLSFVLFPERLSSGTPSLSPRVRGGAIGLFFAGF